MEKTAKEICPHNALRKSRQPYDFDAYVCGSCAKIFRVTEYREPQPDKETMFPKNPIPWGLRKRQA